LYENAGVDTFTEQSTNVETCPHGPEIAMLSMPKRKTLRVTTVAKTTVMFMPANSSSGYEKWT